MGKLTDAIKTHFGETTMNKEMTTLQELLRKSYTGMQAQGAYGYSTEASPGCAYITEDGRRCAVGVLATNDAEASLWQEKDLSAEGILVSRYIFTEKGEKEKTIQMFDRIQAEHDEHAGRGLPFEDFMKFYQSMASEYGVDLGQGDLDTETKTIPHYSNFTLLGMEVEWGVHEHDGTEYLRVVNLADLTTAQLIKIYRKGHLKGFEMVTANLDTNEDSAEQDFIDWLGDLMNGRDLVFYNKGSGIEKKYLVTETIYHTYHVMAGSPEHAEEVYGCLDSNRKPDSTADGGITVELASEWGR